MSVKFDVEYTDTFGGEANYCWVRREVVEMPDHRLDSAKARATYDRELMRRAKAAVGLTGVRGRRDDIGGTLEFRPYRMTTVMFVTFRDGE